MKQLLSLARTEEVSHKRFEDLDLTAAVNDAAASVVHEALNRGVSMEFNMPETRVNVRADPGDLSAMLINLLDNALRYTREKGSIWVTVVDSDEVVLRVEDDGPGIPDSEKQKIFERFYRVPGTNGSGCGLGLSIVGESAKRSNAIVEALDRPGGGTVFCVVFGSMEKNPAQG